MPSEPIALAVSALVIAAMLKTVGWPWNWRRNIEAWYDPREDSQ